jgi:prepilin peptidase CpaA
MPNLLPEIAVLLLTFVAAITDTRAGVIPNWLTLPVVAATPLLRFALSGADAFAASLGGIALCGAVPLALFHMGAMGGGDVKLFAAIGALVGAYVGLEIQWFAYLLGLVGALIALAARGELWPTLKRSFQLLGALLDSRKRNLAVSEVARTSLRLGAPTFVAALITLSLEHAVR